MPTSSLALARERLKTIAGTITGLSGDCVVLVDNFTADFECWKRYAPGGGFRFLAVCESALSFDGVDSPTAIRVYLYASDAANAEALDDLIAALRAAWLDAGNYPGGELVCDAVTV